MAASRQLKLADGPCEWCGALVIGNHRDRRFCDDSRCGVSSRMFRFLTAQGDPEGFHELGELWVRLEQLSASIDRDRSSSLCSARAEPKDVLVVGASVA